MKSHGDSAQIRRLTPPRAPFARVFAAAWAAIALAAGALAPHTARAIQVYLSDDSGVPRNSSIYAANEIVYVSGEWDQFDFPCPIGNLYMVPNDGRSWSGGQITPFVTVKPIQGCYGAGSFLGEILKLPPLPLGDFDIVMDEAQDGVYNSADDYVLGDGGTFAFRVIDTTLDQDVSVAGIKAQAATQAQGWRNYALYTKVSFAAVGLLETGLEATNFALSAGSTAAGFAYAAVGVGTQVLGIPTSYNGAVMQIGEQLIDQACSNTASVYEALAADPADPNYIPLAEVGAIAYQEEVSSLSALNAGMRLRNNLLEQAAVGAAFRSSYEKFLGAEAQNDYPNSLRQTRQAREYCSLLIDLLNTSVTDAQALESAIVAAGWADHVLDATAAAALRTRVTTLGFTGAEQSQMLAAGMTQAEIDDARATITAYDLTGLTSTSYRSQLDGLQAQAQTAVTQLQSVAANLDGVLGRLQYAFTPAPVAVITGGATVAEGATLALSGSTSTNPQGGALTMTWDLNADGVFGEVTGASAGFSRGFAGSCIVGLKVQNAGGQNDVAYKRITVTNVNSIPAFTAISPTALFLSLPQGGSAQGFSVTVTDPDSDPVTVSWLLDGVPVAPGTSYSYTPAVLGLHHIQARAGDTSSLSPDNNQTWRVLVAAGTGTQPQIPPARIELAQNRPNPFNGATTVAFALPQAARVRLVLHDAAGRRLATLLDGERGPGRHETTWNGRAASGGLLPSGVYYCRLEVTPLAGGPR